MTGKPIIFSWGTWNRAHIGEHGVTTDEAAYIVEDARPPFPRYAAQQKLIVWGQTPAGRYLQVIFTFPADGDVDHATLSPVDLADFVAGRVRVAFVLHARDLTGAEKRQLRRRRR